MKLPNVPRTPERSFAGWTGRAAWWHMEGGLTVYATLMRCRRHKLELLIWDGNLCLNYFAARVRNVTLGEPIYADGRRIPNPDSLAGDFEP